MRLLSTEAFFNSHSFLGARSLAKKPATAIATEEYKHVQKQFSLYTGNPDPFAQKKSKSRKPEFGF